MYAVKMTSIRTRSKRGLVEIPGGWTLRVPEVEPTPNDLRALVAALLSDCAGNGQLAARRARETIAAEYARARVANVRLSIARWARKYASMFPERKHGFALEGFDPERLATIYWPEANTGRAGSTYADRWLREMGKA